MYEDDRVDAGIDMDGTKGHMPDNPLPVAQHGLDRPFMLMNSGCNKESEVDSHDRDGLSIVLAAFLRLEAFMIIINIIYGYCYCFCHNSPRTSTEKTV